MKDERDTIKNKKKVAEEKDNSEVNDIEDKEVKKALR